MTKAAAAIFEFGLRSCWVFVILALAKGIAQCGLLLKHFHHMFGILLPIGR